MAILLSLCLSVFIILAWIFVTSSVLRTSGTPGNATPVQI